MAAYLQFSIRFFNDRYHGHEWPPSPARLFQALVAGAKTGAAIRQWSGEHEAALSWLGGLGPPDILARPGYTGTDYTIFVPNNSLDKNGKSSKTSKAVTPTILADHSPGNADVIYRWRVADAESASQHLPALDQVAARVRALGWGVDFAAAIADLAGDVAGSDGLELFTADGRRGLGLRIPEPGFLAHLEECHQRFLGRITTRGIDPYTRPTRFGEVRYRRADSPQPRRWIAFELQHPDGGNFAARWDEAQTVASWLRHAAGQALLQEEMTEAWVNSYVLGHTDPGDLGHRLSFVPLPSVGHRHSDGGIRRVMIVEPPNATSSDAEALELLWSKLSGSLLTDDGKTPRAVLVPPADANKVFPLYVGEAPVWRTVTPIVLHGHNAARGRISVVKTDRLLRQALAATGVPEKLIKEMMFQQAPYWAGCDGAAAIRVPHHLASWPRVHVRVEFQKAVGGPMLAGIGRHYGIGVLAAYLGK